MPSLKEVKGRIISVKSTQQITKAMKMVAAAKLRRAQDRIVQMRPYSQKLRALLDNVSKTLTGDIENVYGVKRDVKKVLIVVVTSDRGLCGGFNSSVIKNINALLESKYKEHHSKKDVTFLCVGKKGTEYFKKKGYPMIDTYSTMFTALTFDNAKSAAEHVMTSFVNGTFDKVDIVYNEFKNVATQIVKVEPFLPLETKPMLSKGAESPVDYIFEPSKVEIVQELIPKSLKINFFRTLLESNAAEHGARMTAMDKATDNAAELLKALQLTYNRTRQAAITKEILEIVGGAEALANG